MSNSNSKKKSIPDRILALPFIKTIIRWSKKVVLPGFDEVPLYDVIYFVIREAKKDNITTRANSIAYNFFLSVFPGIIFLLPIFARIPFVENYIGQLRSSLKGVIPENAEEYIFRVIDGIQTEGAVGWLTLGFFLSIFFASNGMLSLMKGFDKSYDITFKSRNFIWKRIVAISLTLLLSLLMILSITLIVLSKQIVGRIIQSLELDANSAFVFLLIKWIVLILLFYSVVGFIYKYGPSMYRRVKFFSPGATLACFFSILTSVGFSYFVNSFGRYNEIYGTIGSLIVILLWFQFNAFILLVGFELNASIAVNRDLRQLRESPSD